MKTATPLFIALPGDFLWYVLAAVSAEFNTGGRNSTIYWNVNQDAGKLMDIDSEENDREVETLPEAPPSEADDSGYSEFYEYVERTYGL